MAGKKQNGKPHGHYCRVCDTYKANERFSGKGHAVHFINIKELDSKT